jgi:NAD kinase
MTTLPPRVVFVVRETDFELLLARHATRQQAKFFLETRGQDLATVEANHEHFSVALRAARTAAPADWRQTVVKRAELDRFLFAADDIVVALGQDGLVANVAKYLDGQPVLGVNPAPDLYDGVLMRVPMPRLSEMLRASAAGAADIQLRTMAEGVLDTGEKLLALNELFVGHRSHQSARYLINLEGQAERQSSSGLIVCTGTGATGWARSIMESTSAQVPLAPEESALGFFVREPFPSVSTGTSLRSGKVAGNALHVRSQMNDGGVIFADGIEQDYLNFDWGRNLTIAVSDKRMHLVRA